MERLRARLYGLARVTVEALRRHSGEPDKAARRRRAIMVSDSDVYFLSSEAVKAGLADEIWTTPAPLPDKQAAGGGEILDETDEAEFWRLMSRWDTVRVKDREQFLDSLARWGFYRVKSG